MKVVQRYRPLKVQAVSTAEGGAAVSTAEGASGIDR